MEIKVRKAKFEDLEVFLAAGIEIRTLEDNSGCRVYKDEKSFLREFSKFLLLIQDRDNYKLYVAESEGKILGCLLGHIMPMETFFKNVVCGHISLIWVDDEYRSKKVGTMLVATFEADMWAMGIQRIVATIHQNNTIPQQGLLKLGYHYEYVELSKEL